MHIIKIGRKEEIKLYNMYFTVLYTVKIAATSCIGDKMW